jgi:hypothetical protein
VKVGNQWIQANTQPTDVFMTTDPVSRYLYIHRHTLDYPATVGEFWDSLTRYDVTYLLLTRSLNAIKSSWSMAVGMQPDEQVETVIRPILEGQPQCFSLVYADPPHNAEIYQVQSECKLHHSEWTPD